MERETRPKREELELDTDTVTIEDELDVLDEDLGVEATADPDGTLTRELEAAGEAGKPDDE